MRLSGSAVKAIGRLRMVQRRLVAEVAMLRYDQYTIAEHFRRQGATIGQGCRLLVKSLGSEPYLVSIGDETLISTDVMFVTHDGGTWAFRDQCPGVNRFARIDVGSRVFVGARSILLPGIRIGDRAVVGAGSVITHDVPSEVVVAGAPAKILMTLDEYRARCQAESLPLSGCSGLSKRLLLERSVPPAGRPRQDVHTPDRDGIRNGTT